MSIQLTRALLVSPSGISSILKWVLRMEGRKTLTTVTRCTYAD